MIGGLIVARAEEENSYHLTTAPYDLLTDRIEAEIRAYVGKIDQVGGTLQAIELGFGQEEIQESAYQVQRTLVEKRQIVVGVNEFAGEDTLRVPIFVVDERVAGDQCQRLLGLRVGRDGERVRAALKNRAEPAAGPGNPVPPVLEAVRACATSAEICNTLRPFLASIKRLWSCKGLAIGGQRTAGSGRLYGDRDISCLTIDASDRRALWCRGVA